MQLKRLIALSALTCAMSAQAVTTVVSDFTYDYDPGNFTTNVRISPQLSGPNNPQMIPGAGGFSVTHGSASFAAYCVQVNIPLEIPSTYTDNYNLVSGAAGFGSREADLKKLFSWASANFVPNNAAKSAALQAAVWEIVHEDNPVYSFSLGRLQTTSFNSSVTAELANINWGAIAASPANWTVQRLSYIPGSPWGSPVSTAPLQELVVFAPIPEASTLAMMLLGLAGVGAVARRQRQG